MIRSVELTARAMKDLRKVPTQVLDKFELWIRMVETMGLTEVRKIPGFHDEPLAGDRKSQRSIRLNQAYRAFYVIRKGTVEFVSVLEVNKHKY